MPLLSIEASGKVGIGNFTSHTPLNTNAPQAMLDITAKSGSDADIFLKTSTRNTIPLIKLEVDDYGHQNMSGTSTRLYNPNLYRGEFYIHTDYASGSFYEKQKTNSVVIESKGKEEGLAGQTYPFNIRGATQNNFEANNIQLVVGGDNSPNRNSSITSSHIHDGVYPSFSTNNGRAAITIEGISDFRRFGEVGIGLESPSSSLHVTRSVQADNFRTTNPVDIPINGSNPSIQTIYGSNQLTGSNTQFISDFKVGDAVKITGRSIIATPLYEYEITSSHATASVKPAISQGAFTHKQFISNDLILISSGALHTGIIQTGSFHTVTSPVSGSLNNTVFDSNVLFIPSYTGVTTQSINLIHRVNPYHYQIATVDGIFSDTSMSISQNWEGVTWSGSKGYKEDILFQVKTADYNPVFTINAHGDITGSGTASFGYLDITNSSIQTFKDDGVRVGDSSIDGDLTVTGTLTAQEFHTEFISSSIIFQSGSTQFGNSSDDTHTFSGSINVKDEGHITASGNISASGTLYGSEAYIKGHITASGNISASGFLTAQNITSSANIRQHKRKWNHNSNIIYRFIARKCINSNYSFICPNCFICRKCSNSFLCRKCSNCFLCNFSSNCFICRKCSNSFLCRKCSNCFLCNYSSNCFICRKCSNSFLCNYSSNSFLCNFSSNSFLCRKCSNCFLCKHT
jgi:hypothetical protein